MKECIYVIEDDENIREIIDLALTSAGYNVKQFSNALDALKCMENDQVDLAVFDLMLPGISGIDAIKKIRETESIIYSMTLEERRDPSIITLSRKQRIAKGCGKDLAAINRLLKQFEQSKQMMKQMSNMDSATGLPKMGGGHFVGGPNRKKVRHKKKKKK